MASLEEKKIDLCHRVEYYIQFSGVEKGILQFILFEHSDAGQKRLGIQIKFIDVISQNSLISNRTNKT